MNGINFFVHSFSSIGTSLYESSSKQAVELKTKSLLLKERMIAIVDHFSSTIADFESLEGAILTSRLALAYLAIFASLPSLRSGIKIVVKPIQTAKDLCCALNSFTSIGVFFGENSFQFPRNKFSGGIDYAEIFAFLADGCDTLSFCMTYDLYDFKFLAILHDAIAGLPLFSFGPIQTLFPCNPKALFNLISIGTETHTLIKYEKRDFSVKLKLSINLMRALLIVAFIYLEKAHSPIGCALNGINFILRHTEVIQFIYEKEMARRARLQQ